MHDSAGPAWLLATTLAACQSSDSAPGAAALVHGHGCDAAIVAEAERVLRPAVPLLRELLGQPAVDGLPGVVHLHGTIAGYERAARALAPDRVANLAFSHFASRTAHVALQPPPLVAGQAPVSLPWLSRQLLLHELAHLVVYEAFANARRHPMLVAEGLSSWLQAEATRRLGWHQDLGEDPYWATKLVLAVAGDAPLPTLAHLLQDRDSPRAPMHRRYAIAYRAFAALAREPSWVADFLATLQALPDDRTLPMRLHDRLQADGLLAAWQRGFAEHAPVPARWHEERRSLDTSRQPWRQIAFPEHDARCWRIGEGAAGERDLEIVLEAEGGVRPAPSMHVLLGRTPNRWLRVDFSTEGVAIDEIDAASERPVRRLGATTAPPARLRPGRVVHATIRTDAGGIRVDVEGAEVLHLGTAHPTTRGTWGLGVAAGTSGRWHLARAH